MKHNRNSNAYSQGSELLPTQHRTNKESLVIFSFRWHQLISRECWIWINWCGPSFNMPNSCREPTYYRLYC